MSSVNWWSFSGTWCLYAWLVHTLKKNLHTPLSQIFLAQDHFTTWGKLSSLLQNVTYSLDSQLLRIYFMEFQHILNLNCLNFCKKNLISNIKISTMIMWYLSGKSSWMIRIFIGLSWVYKCRGKKWWILHKLLSIFKEWKGWLTCYSFSLTYISFIFHQTYFFFNLFFHPFFIIICPFFKFFFHHPSFMPFLYIHFSLFSHHLLIYFFHLFTCPSLFFLSFSLFCISIFLVHLFF